MNLDESHPMNRLLIEHLSGRRPQQGRTVQPIAAPDAHPNPYEGAGSHPDVVERLWDDLGSALPLDCRALVHGTPGLMHPGAGVVLALAYGTQYAIRIPADTIEAARAAGCITETEWTGGERTNIEETLGRGWVFGCWADAEKQWLAEMYARLGNDTWHGPAAGGGRPASPYHPLEASMIEKAGPEGYKKLLEGVSLKTLVCGEKTHLTQVRLKKGAVVPEHQHPHEQTGYLISGGLRFFSGDEEAVAGPGDSWSFHGGVPHGAEALEDTVVLELFSPVREDYLKL